MASENSGKNKLLLLIIIILVILLLAGGAGAWFMLNKSKSTAAATPVVAAQQPAQPELFYKLEPFTVNLSGGEYSGRLLYVHITLQLGDKSTEEYLKQHLPQLRNRLLMVLSDQDAADLVTSEGKIKLAGQIRESLNKPFGKDNTKLSVEGVLFTQFIVQ